MVNQPTKKLGQGCGSVRDASSNCRSLRCLAGSRYHPPPACSPLPARAGHSEGRAAALTGSRPAPRGEANTPPPAPGGQDSAGQRPRTLCPGTDAERPREPAAGIGPEPGRGGVARGSSSGGEGLGVPPGRGVELDSAPGAGAGPRSGCRGREAPPLRGVAGGGAAAARGESRERESGRRAEGRKSRTRRRRGKPPWERLLSYADRRLWRKVRFLNKTGWFGQSH